MRSFVYCSAFLLITSAGAACVDGDSDIEPTEDKVSVSELNRLAVDSVRVDPVVVPESERLEYRSFSKKAASSHYDNVAGLRASITSLGGDRRQLEAETNGVRKTSVLHASGAAPADEAGIPAAFELVQHLPPPNTELRIGEAYLNAQPTIARIRQNQAKEQLVMSQRIEHTPIKLWRSGPASFARVEIVAANHLYFLDDRDPSNTIQNMRIGAAYVGVADLLHVRGHGWRLLRLARITAEKPEDRRITDLAQARAVPHNVFTACLASSSLFETRQLSRTDVAIPEFARCASR